MEESVQLAKQQNFKKAQAVIDDAISKIEKSSTSLDPFSKGLIQDLTKSKEGLVDKTSFSTGGEQLLVNNSIGQQKQRSTNMNLQSQQVYCNQFRSELRKKK